MSRADKDVAFLREAAEFFEHADSMGEDRAFWANVSNARRCREIADRLDALPASKAAAWALKHKSDGNMWLYSQKSRAEADQRPCHDLVPLFAHPPTDAGVSEAMVEAFQEKYREVAERYHWGNSWPAKAPSRELLDAALSTAIPAGDGVPPGMARNALDCVVHALMVLPVPIDGQGKRAWASLLEAQTILEGLSTASTDGKG